jgi:hypothetical protein
MKKFIGHLYHNAIYSVNIEAEDEEEAADILENIDPDDCYLAVSELDFVEVNETDQEHRKFPSIRQTSDGYEVIKKP